MVAAACIRAPNPFVLPPLRPRSQLLEAYDATKSQRYMDQILVLLNAQVRLPVLQPQRAEVHAPRTHSLCRGLHATLPTLLHAQATALGLALQHRLSSFLAVLATSTQLSDEDCRRTAGELSAACG